MHSHAVELSKPFAHAVGNDGVSYIVVPLAWSVDAIKEYHQKFIKFNILPDNVPHDLASFGAFVLNSRALWFEVIEEDNNEAIGVIFLDDFVFGPIDRRMISASYHAAVWDAKFSKRLPVHRAFVRAIFAQFKLHRLETEIPLYAGGAIRVALKAGFVSEGTRRRVRWFRGQWYNAALLSILETEVP